MSCEVKSTFKIRTPRLDPKSSTLTTRPTQSKTSTKSLHVDHTGRQTSSSSSSSSDFASSSRSNKSCNNRTIQDVTIYDNNRQLIREERKQLMFEMSVEAFWQTPD